MKKEFTSEKLRDILKTRVASLKQIRALQERMLAGEEKLLTVNELIAGHKYIVACTKEAREDMKRISVISPEVDEKTGKLYVYSRPSIEEMTEMYGEKAVSVVRAKKNGKYSRKRVKMILTGKGTFFTEYSKALA